MSDKGMNGEVGVRVVTLSWCDICQWLKSELKAAGINYVDIDAEQFTDFADKLEAKYKTDTYPMVIIEKGNNIVTILSSTSLDTTDTLRTFDTVPQLVEMIKQYIK